MDAPSVVVSVRGVRKTFGRVVALDRMDLEVRAGEVFGLLGPNGAGKSTMVKILLGLVRPTDGEAELFGHRTGAPEGRRSVGYLPELFRFQPWMTGRQLLRYHGELAGIDPDALQRQIPELLHEVGMADRADRRISGYSKGMSQRIGLAQAMLGEPDLVVLDEPTSALDPVGRREVRVDRVEAGLVARLSAIGETEVVDGATVLVRLADPDHAADVASAVLAAGHRLLALVPASTSLEDVFVGMVRGGDR